MQGNRPHGVCLAWETSNPVHLSPASPSARSLLQTPISPRKHPPATPTFAVATIKPSNPDARNSNLNGRPNGITTENLPVDDLIKFAYNLNTGTDDQIIGEPKWLRSAKFDIVAKYDDATAAAISKMNQDDREHTATLMVQALLADRFHLKIHHETRPLPVLALTIANSGPKLSKPADTRGASSTTTDRVISKVATYLSPCWRICSDDSPR